MKTAGIIGGIGPASTLDYYNDIIEGCREDGHYPKIIIDSIDMAEMLAFVEASDKKGLAGMLLSEIVKLKAAGADFAAIASNTPHIVIDAVKAEAVLPVIDIVEETCKYAAARGVKNAVVLGTGFTMAAGFYNKGLIKYGINSYVPDAEGQKTVHNIIFPNLENGLVLPEDKAKIIYLTEKLIKSGGADALILGCTELPLIIKKGDIDTLILNTTSIHTAAIIKRILSK